MCSQTDSSHILEHTQNEKLIRAGCHVSGIVDSFTGAVVSLVALPSKRAELVAYEMCRAIHEFDGVLPKILRVDGGSENVIACSIVSRFVGSKYYAGPSTRNQPVEQLWR